MENVSIGISSIIVAAFIFYFVIKGAVKKALIEVKANEQELILKYRADEMGDKVALKAGFTDGDYFKGIAKEAKESFQKERRDISEQCSAIYLSNKTDEEKYATYRELWQQLVEIDQRVAGQKELEEDVKK
ncbi:hypothetical protein [Isobaculum melis]|uniref:Uncharacterized protein n=1 Tax=Isobaculum melis TaxID=142588 RepID=A0A1H9QTV2_9LACT|nr:hypothetical protein [Isobaculum melis]SER63896.1 hypothetical protein SAMN04488559_102282 [Isobaculum melis]